MVTLYVNILHNDSSALLTIKGKGWMGGWSCQWIHGCSRMVCFYLESYYYSVIGIEEDGTWEVGLACAAYMLLRTLYPAVRVPMLHGISNRRPRGRNDWFDWLFPIVPSSSQTCHGSHSPETLMESSILQRPPPALYWKEEL